MSKIIVHPGSAHLDDTLSIALILAQNEDIEIIERRIPTIEEINDPNIWVLDIGCVLDPNIKSFDHHQEKMDDCTFSLLLKEWGLWESSKCVFPSFEFAVIKDCKGDHALAKSLGIEQDIISALKSPLEEAILDEMSKISQLNNKDPLFIILKIIGRAIFSKIEDYNYLNDLVIKNANIITVKGVKIQAFFDEKPSRTLNLILEKNKKNKWGTGGISVTQDIRDPNAIVFYCHDEDPRINFNKLKNNPSVQYIHQFGFLASVKISKEKEIEDCIKEIVLQSLVDT